MQAFVHPMARGQACKFQFDSLIWFRSPRGACVERHLENVERPHPHSSCSWNGRM